MVQASIKCDQDSDGITGGKSYPVVGFMGGCAIIVDDKNRFVPLSFANVSDYWSVSTDSPKSDQSPAPAAPAPSPAPAAPVSEAALEPEAQTKP